MEEALILLEKVDKVISLGEKGLARIDEVYEIEKGVVDFLKKNIDFDSEFGREYDKWSKIPIWHTIPHDGFADRSHLAPIHNLRDFLTRCLDSKEIEVLPTQQYIRTNEVFTGRKALRDILSQAREKIDIQDNYLDFEIFAILEPYLIANSGLEVRLLTNINISNAFRSDLTAFVKQFPKTVAKSHNQSHGRFVIIDNNVIYSVGHSLKDIGKKADAILRIDNEVAKKKTLDDFETWWKDSINIRQ